MFIFCINRKRTAVISKCDDAVKKDGGFSRVSIKNQRFQIKLRDAIRRSTRFTEKKRKREISDCSLSKNEWEGEVIRGEWINERAEISRRSWDSVHYFSKLKE